MEKVFQIVRISGVTVLMFLMAGCSPTLEVGGAYFPAWLLCMVAGFLASVVLRGVLLGCGLDRWVRPRMLAYPAACLAMVLGLYLLFFR